MARLRTANDEEGRRGAGGGDWKNDTQSGRQADRQTDGQLGKDCSSEDTEKQKCKVVVLKLWTWFSSALHYITSKCTAYKRCDVLWERLSEEEVLAYLRRTLN